MTSVSVKDINKLAIPAIMAGITEPLISIVDTAIIGHLSVTSLAAVGIASSFFLLIVWVLSQMKSAISAIVAKAYGANQIESIQTLIPQAIISSMLVGVLFYALTFPFSKEIFQLYNAKGGILNEAIDYYSIRSLGYAFTLGTFSVFGVYRGFQNTLWAMYISMAGGLLNLVLDFALIFGIEGWVPAMGVKGAALATLITQVFMFFTSLVVLKKKLPHSYRFSSKINPQLKELFGMSFDLFIRTIALNVAYYLGNRFSTGYGEEYIAAHTIAMNVWLFSAFFIDGYANAGNAIAGRLLGANKLDELFKTGKRILSISVKISFILVAVYALSYNLTGQVFTNDETVRKVFKSIFWMVIISQPINAIAFALDGIFKGLGATKLLRNVLLSATFIGFVPVIYACDYFGLHIYSVWIAFIGWMIIRAGSLYIKFYRDYKSSTT